MLRFYSIDVGLLFIDFYERSKNTASESLQFLRSFGIDPLGANFVEFLSVKLSPIEFLFVSSKRIDVLK